MKPTLTIIACVAICSAITVSCKNAKTTAHTPEEIQQQKQALADSVLADIDALAEQFYDTQSQSFMFKSMELTEDEIMVKPDYFLAPSVANTLVTKEQKINALAIYSVELAVRKIYNMPYDDVKECITKLAAELNHPLDVEFLTSDIATSEKIKRAYDICKERGDLAYFWQSQYALMSETSYIISQNPELFYSKITDEQWRTFCSRFCTIEKAVEKLAEYDEEMSQLLEFNNKFEPYASEEEMDITNQNIETVIQFHITNKDKYIDRRNALLQ